MSSWFIRRANVSAGGSEPTPRLPDTFTELAYLQSDGNQYIDTGVVPSSNIDLTVDLQLLASSVGYIFGRYISNAQYYLYVSNYGSSQAQFQFGWSSPFMNTGCYVDNNRHTIRLYSNGTNSYMDVDGANVTSKASANHSGNTYSFLLFRGAEGSSVKAGISHRVYACKMVNRSTQADVLDLVPAKRNADSVVGFYDLVSDSFLTNNGSGSFNYGEL